MCLSSGRPLEGPEELLSYRFLLARSHDSNTQHCWTLPALELLPSVLAAQLVCKVLNTGVMVGVLKLFLQERERQAETEMRTRGGVVVVVGGGNIRGYQVCVFMCVEARS